MEWDTAISGDNLFLLFFFSQNIQNGRENTERMFLEQKIRRKKKSKSNDSFLFPFDH